MEYLTDSLREVISKLSENQKKEVDVIESIVKAALYCHFLEEKWDLDA